MRSGLIKTAAENTAINTITVKSPAVLSDEHRNANRAATAT